MFGRISGISDFSDAINMKCKILIFVNGIKNILRCVLQMGARQLYVGIWSPGSGKTSYCIEPSAGSQLSAHKFVVGFGAPRALKLEIEFLGTVAIRLQRLVSYLRRH